MEELKIGDLIYRKNHSTITSLGKVIRVTKTMAFTENSKFRRTYRNPDSLTITPRDTWSSCWYFIPDESQREEYMLQEKRRTVTNYNYHSLSAEKIQMMYAILMNNLV